MTQEEYRAAAEAVIYLTSCALNGKTPNTDEINLIDLAQMYTVAQKHMLNALVGMMLQSVGVHDERIDQETAKAKRKAVLLGADVDAVTECLEQAGIWYMPLKGSVLKELYPEYDMRQMSDVDILVDAGRTQDVKDIMEKLGFLCKAYGKGCHDIYHKPPVSNFEIHSSLFGDTHDERFSQYYRSIKERLVKDEGNAFRLHFTPEDSYVYMIAHEHKHYSSGGTGLRSLADTYVYIKHKDLNFDYISAETKKLGIAEYERQNRELAMHLFGGENLTDTDRQMLEYILSSGTYGTTEHRVSNQIEKLGGGTCGKLKYLWSRIFIPMESVKGAYPFFYKHKILLPVLPFYRAWKGLTLRPQRIRNELKALISRAKRDNQ